MASLTGPDTDVQALFQGLCFRRDGSPRGQTRDMGGQFRGAVEMTAI